MAGKDVRDRDAAQVLALNLLVRRWGEKEQWAAGSKLLPLKAGEVSGESSKFRSTRSDEIRSNDPPGEPWPLEEKKDCGALSNSREKVLVVRAVSLSPVAVEVKRPDLLKRLEQREAESSEGGGIQGVVIDDEGDDSGTVTVDDPLSEPKELDAIVLKPLRVALAQREPVNLVAARVGTTIGQLIAMEEGGDPGAAVGRKSDPRWVAQNDGQPP